MEDKGLDESFNIDKKWVEKKLKKEVSKQIMDLMIKGKLNRF